MRFRNAAAWLKELELQLLLLLLLLDISAEAPVETFVQARAGCQGKCVIEKAPKQKFGISGVWVSLRCPRVLAFNSVEVDWNLVLGFWNYFDEPPVTFAAQTFLEVAKEHAKAQQRKLARRRRHVHSFLVKTFWRGLRVPCPGSLSRVSEGVLHVLP